MISKFLYTCKKTWVHIPNTHVKSRSHQISPTLTKEIQSLQNLFTSKFSQSSTSRNPMGGRERRRNCGWYIKWVKKIKNKINDLITAICFFMQTYLMNIHFLSHLLWVFFLCDYVFIYSFNLFHISFSNSLFQHWLCTVIFV